MDQPSPLVARGDKLIAGKRQKRGSLGLGKLLFAVRQDIDEQFRSAASDRADMNDDAV
jgi:hypothetical protein